jgi:hypothetical protein
LKIIVTISSSINLDACPLWLFHVRINNSLAVSCQTPEHRFSPPWTAEIENEEVLGPGRTSIALVMIEIVHKSELHC